MWVLLKQRKFEIQSLCIGMNLHRPEVHLLLMKTGNSRGKNIKFWHQCFIRICLQTLLRLSSTSHRCAWSAHSLTTYCVLSFEIGTDSYCASCLHYSYCVPVILPPGVIFILHYQIAGAYASKLPEICPQGLKNVNFAALHKIAWNRVILVEVVLCI